MINIRKQNALIKIMNNSLIELPAPSNISFWWNFGSLLSLCLMVQIITGLFLAMHYSSDVKISFDSVIYIIRDVNYGWILRTLHANGASFFFICLYTHIGRGLYYSSFKLKETWTIGVILLFMVMGTAFVGYVLPWGQMSFWGATVITNLLSAIPYLGEYVVQWVWGGFAVDNPTLTRFFSLHFMLPFIISALVVVHLLFLHQTGSNNPLGISSDPEKISFHPFFSSKDIYGFIIMMWLMTLLILTAPNLLGDVENFIPANPMVTPAHIQPEWYFLFAYAILRSIPNKLGGVLGLIMSIAILLAMPALKNSKSLGMQFVPMSQILIWMMLNNIILLTWVGACPVEPPYVLAGQMFTLNHFMYFFLDPIQTKIWQKMVLTIKK